MQALQSHSILILSPMAGRRNPQTLVHGLEDGFGFLTIGRAVLADDFGNACGEQVATIVVSRGVGDGACVVIEGIAGPDAAVSVIEMVAVGVEVTLLPSQV